jgi:glycosyltransferase involved in cell wall biosynthesis
MFMRTILLTSPYWKEPHRWMVSSVKLAELWQRMGYRVVCVCMGKGDREDVSETLTIYRVPDLFLPDPLNYGIAPTFLFHVLSVIRKEKPDIVVVNKILFWSSLVTPILRLLGHKPIVTVDALVGLTWWPRGFVPKMLAAIGAWVHAWPVLLCAKKVIFFHPQPRKVLRMLLISHKSSVVPTGIDEEPYRTREPFGDIVITYTGRLESVKGVDDFLAASVPLKKEFPEISIQVVGWYKENHPLVEQYQRDVAFTGLRDDIPAILAKTDIFVLPSYSEGLSNALMEAMASGCACIASEVGGNRYLIENGISGFLFPPGDRGALRVHIRRLIADAAKRESMGKAARKRIEKHFSWRVVEKRYRRLFEEVLGG